MRQALLHPTLVIVPFVRNLESMSIRKGGLFVDYTTRSIGTIGTAKWSLRPTRCPALPSGR